jgi:hypothetical protein
MAFGESVRPEDQRKLAEFAAKQAIGEYRGEIYALQLETALKELRRKRMVTFFQATRLHSRADRSGIDYWIGIGPKRRVPLGVTSTSDGRRKRERKHPLVPGIHIKTRKRIRRIEEIKTAVLACICRYEFEAALKKCCQANQIADWARVDANSKISHQGASHAVAANDGGTVFLGLTATEKERQKLQEKHPRTPVSFMVMRDESKWKSRRAIQEELVSLVNQKPLQSSRR